MRASFVEKLSEAMAMSVIDVPKDVVKKIEKAYATEKNKIAQTHLKNILDNIKIAGKERLPVCEDTGIQTIYVTAGYDFPLLEDLWKSLPLALKKATLRGPLRPNTVDPFTGKNHGDNLGHNMPALTLDLAEGDSAEIHILPKGGGSEHMSALWMLSPSEGPNGMKRKILEHVQKAGGKPCPPIILGIGIGGSADLAMRLAKKSLLRPLDEPMPDKKIAALEDEILRDVNALGIGPMGMGGTNTALAVHIEYAYRHPATFPVGLVVQCWCDRRAKITISKDGDVSW
jgi:fumarate hydratase subunit alpha